MCGGKFLYNKFFFSFFFSLGFKGQVRAFFHMPFLLFLYPCSVYSFFFPESIILTPSCSSRQTQSIIIIIISLLSFFSFLPFFYRSSPIHFSTIIHLLICVAAALSGGLYSGVVVAVAVLDAACTTISSSSSP